MEIPVHPGARQMLGREYPKAEAGALYPGGQRFVLADLAAYRGVAADFEIAVTPNQQKLAVRVVFRSRPVSDRRRGLGAGNYEHSGRNDDTLPKAAELLPRMERQHVDALSLGRRRRGEDELRAREDIGVDETKPFPRGQQRAAPAGMRFACPAFRQRASNGESDGRAGRGLAFRKGSSAVIRVVVDNDDRRGRGETSLRLQPRQTDRDIVDLIADRNDDRDRGQSCGRGDHFQRRFPMGGELPKGARQQKEFQPRPKRTETQCEHLRRFPPRRCARHLPWTSGVAHAERSPRNPQFVVISQKRLARCGRWIEGAGQTPQYETFAEAVDPAEQRGVGGHSFEPIARRHPSHLRNTKAGRQRSLAAKRTDFPPLRVTFDEVSQYA